MAYELTPRTDARGPAHTPPEVNQRIRHQLAVNVLHYAEHPDEIDARLQELDREWDVERTLETNAALVMLGGLTLGRIFRGLSLLPLVAAGFLLQYAIQGWCPPVALFRRLGVRTALEINQERFALRALRGELRDLPGPGQDVQTRVARALRAAEHAAGEAD
jgi:hypothetical protein